MLGCDLMVGAGKEALGAMDAKRTCAVMNTDVAPTGAFTQDPDWQTSPEAMLQRVREAALVSESLDATSIATALMGDAVATNVFMLGYAWQRGWIPLGEAALLKAIELNGAAVPMNQAAFAWGRQAALDLPAVRAAAGLEKRGVVVTMPPRTPSLDAVLADRTTRLAAYQDAAYAQRYERFVREIAATEQQRTGGDRLHGSGRQPVQADGLQGRVRGGAPVRRDRVLRQGRAAVRGRLLAALPSGAAAVLEARRRRPSGQAALWSLDRHGLQMARQGQAPARHAARHLRLHGRAPRRAGGDRRSSRR